MLDDARGASPRWAATSRTSRWTSARADEAFETLRALAFARGFGPSLAALRGVAKDTLHLERRAGPGP